MACLNSSVLPPASGCALRIRSRKACKEVYPQAGSTAEDQAGKQQQHSCEQTSADGAGVSKFGSLFLDAGGSGSANLNVSRSTCERSEGRIPSSNISQPAPSETLKRKSPHMLSNQKHIGRTTRKSYLARVCGLTVSDLFWG